MSRLLLCSVLLLISSITLADAVGKGLTRLPAGMPAPDFTLQDTEGKTHRLADYRGRTVIINFWTTWCPPCREEIPSMNRALHLLDPDQVVMLGINMGEDDDTIFIFTADFPTEFPMLLDRNGAVTEDWPVKGLPTTYIVAPDGSLAFRAIGGRDWDAPEVLEQIRALGKH